MEERWIIISSYKKLIEANQDADTLKASGIDCHIILGEPEKAFVFDDGDEWIYLEVQEEDYDDAAEILELETSTFEKLEEGFEVNPRREAKRRYGLIFWGGVFSVIIVIKLIADVVAG